MELKTILLIPANITLIIIVCIYAKKFLAKKSKTPSITKTQTDSSYDGYKVSPPWANLSHADLTFEEVEQGRIFFSYNIMTSGSEKYVSAQTVVTNLLKIQYFINKFDPEDADYEHFLKDDISGALKNLIDFTEKIRAHEAKESKTS